MENNEPGSEDDLQEALSHRYVDAARVVPLASGRFAVFSLVTSAPAIVTSHQLPEAIEAAARRSGENWATSRERERQDPEPVAVNATIGELGL